MKRGSNSSKTINGFKYKQFEAEVILWVIRWVHEYAPKLEKKIKPYLKQSNDS